MEINYSLLSEDANILVVDDTVEDLISLTRMLKDSGYIVRPVPNGRLAFSAARTDKPDLILLDITIPEMDGFEVCRLMKEDPLLNEVPILFMSAHSQTSEKIKAFEVGGVDYITKPFQIEEVKVRVETHLKLHRLKLDLKNQVEKQVKEITESHMGMIFALAKLAEVHDNETGKHLERIQIFCRMIAEKLQSHPKYRGKIDEAYCERIYSASPLHDIGKVGIPDSILLKPAKLTDEEFEIMKTHSIIGSQTMEILQQKFPNNAFLRMGIDIARSHHEKWNGKGYPDRLIGENIPLCARIMAVADVYDAVRSKRIYKPTVSHQETCEIIQRDSGIHFDPVLIEIFTELQNSFNDIWSTLQD